MHISSLPSPYGIGTLGQAAYDFADFLKAAGQHYWQLLPIGPTSYGDSPYQSFSTHAGNPYFIDLDLLREDGLLTQDEIDAVDWEAHSARVDYGFQYSVRFDLLYRAFLRGWERDADAVREFRNANPWVEDYALYMALKRSQDMRSWETWPEEIRLRRPGAAETYAVRLGDDVHFFIYLQYLFFGQWDALRSYVHALGLEIIGDLPIYVPYDSCDVWANPSLFQLDETGLPTGVAGCPPDYFSADGQLWGNPLYDWERMRQTDYAWWKERIAAAARLFDVIRIDHFRGLESYSREPSNYLPHRYIRNCICYSGTHDNETLAQWLAQTSETARAYAAEYLGLTEQEGYAWGILRSGLASVADTFIAQLQDYLGLGAEARMNTPGTLSDRNWSWRLQPGLLTAELAHRLRRMNTMYERL